jgi:hypothetical protein
MAVIRIVTTNLTVISKIVLSEYSRTINDLSASIQDTRKSDNVQLNIVVNKKPQIPLQ